ncbi:hypothetical protein pkur_cds_537 [Pandoravirus kuranda]|uniref:F-box domain containing protein n=1 Tax=Pandoravirus kuranda TaxID=3019033 RepID=A0AA95ENC2_9VIRU|nr:hypothetical protein pkur_cds_537 [Pandoravirus kuranda]
MQGTKSGSDEMGTPWGVCPWACTAPPLAFDRLPAEVWDHVLAFVDDDRDVASMAASCRLLRDLSARPRRRLALCRWERVRALMGDAVDAWEAQTAIDWRPRFDLQECELAARHNGGTCDDLWCHPLGAWMCDRGIPSAPDRPVVICGACAAEIDPAAWPRCRIDLGARYVGTWDAMLYETQHWWRSHRLVDGVDFIVPPALVEWADLDAAASLADRWQRPARYGLAADTERRPLHGMLYLGEGLALPRMGSVRGWLPVAWRRVAIAWAHSGRRLWGAQYVLVCCDRASPLWGAGAIVEQNATLAMGRWWLVTDDLSALATSPPRLLRTTAGARSTSSPVQHGPVFVDDATTRRPTKAARRWLVAQCWDRVPRDTQRSVLPLAHAWARVRTLRDAVEDEAPIETAGDDDQGAFWHCAVMAYPQDRRRTVYADVDPSGRRGLFW